MFHRLAVVENRRTLADSGTQLVPLDITDPISALYLEVRATNGATSNRSNLIPQNISKIEVIDGSKVIFSLTGEEAFALACYRSGRLPYILANELPGTVQNAVIPIRFGRWLYDTSLALDPAKFRNLQLRVQWNLATVTAVGATGFATGTGALSVFADVMEGGPAPSGCITAKQHYTWATAASGITYIDMPMDNPYKSLLVRGYLAGTALYGVLSHLKMNCDQGKLVPFDNRMTDLHRYWSMEYGPFAYGHQFYAADGNTLASILKLDEAVALCVQSGDTVAQYAALGVGQGTLDLLTGGSAQSSAQQISGNIAGYAPFACAYVPFGDPSDPDDWFPVGTFKQVRLELTNAAASGVGSVVVEQLNTY